ncbi:MAG: bifunctional 5,10-methylene-tetrahydrofolate dehydrogenase/5,10-methylene-tetrahydrofolate cyclohydrolase [Truepera sp.]|nr:bifunctional 5,10-methylene-tetrahydrofolate dehydrogenase/5,10-methylene-tetrahydrofolate cyclohydrolase [Truepera sp.]
MSAVLLSGHEVAEALAAELAAELATLPFIPKLAFVRVGEDPASVAYVRGKNRLAQRLGLATELHALPEATTQAELMALIAQLNTDPAVDGILVQLPLPPQLDSKPVLEAIDPAKDVDGFHPVNVGRLWSGQPTLVPCTPAGLIRILDHYQLPIEGRHAVIIGRSNLVGKPAAALFLRRHATVTLAHSRTRGLEGLARQADILVAAIGKAGFVKPAMVKPGAMVLDVGISRLEGRLVGDVDPEVTTVAAYLTPMPGGTGPMTVAMLMRNTLDAAKARRREPCD